MKKFNPEEYDDVQTRIERFLKDHPDGRIATKLLTPAEHTAESAMFVAHIYESGEELARKTPKATGYAYEERVRTKSVSKSGIEYESVNYTSWTENCETSAIGRALANAGYTGSKRPTRQEMEKVGRMTKVAPNSAVAVQQSTDGVTVSDVSEVQSAEYATSRQITFLQSLLKKGRLGLEELPETAVVAGKIHLERITKSEASAILDKFSKK